MTVKSVDEEVIECVWFCKDTNNAWIGPQSDYFNQMTIEKI